MRVNRAVLGFGFAFASLAELFACGGGNDNSGQGSGGGGGTGVVVSAECKAFAEARCNQESTCAPYRFARFYLNADVCKAGFGRVCQDRMDAPDSGANATAVSACAADFAKMSCTSYMNYDYPASCEYHGTRADGAACGTDAQCQNAYCVLDNEAWAFVDSMNLGCGHCKPTPPRAGEKCDWAGDRLCYPPLSTLCEGNAVCTKFLPDGSSCGGNDCYGSSLCNNGTGKCESQYDAGHACLQTAEASLHGDEGCNYDVLGMVCNKTTQICEKGPKLAGEGDACDPTQLPCGVGDVCTPGPTVCGPDLHCDAQSKTCKRLPSEGESCVNDLGTEIRCLWPFTCRQGTCRLFDASTCK